MKDVTVDVMVFRYGSRGNTPYEDNCNCFIGQVAISRTCLLAVDADGYIEKQYDRQLKSSEFAQWCLMQLRQSDRIKQYPRARILPATRRRLQEARFPVRSEDYRNYVLTAASTEEKVLITRDFRDYTPRTCRILKNEIGLKVEGPVYGCDRLGCTRHAP